MIASRPIRTATAAALAAVAVAVLSACADTPASEDSAAVVARLGAVPIPSAPPAAPIPDATPGHPQVLAIGQPVTATIPGGATALVTLIGPEITPAAAVSGPPDHGTAVFTLHATTLHGTVPVAAADFSGRDDRGRALALTSIGPATASTGTGAVTLRLGAPVHVGAAQLTWRPAGTAMALWTFNVELG